MKAGATVRREDLRRGACVAVRRAKARISSGCDSRPDNWSLHPVAIGAAVEVTRPSKPSRQRVASGGSASRQAATEVNAVQAPKQPDVGADPVALRGRPSSRETEGVTPHDATRSRGLGGGLPAHGDPTQHGKHQAASRVNSTGRPRGPGRAPWGGGGGRRTGEAG